MKASWQGVHSARESCVSFLSFRFVRIYRDGVILFLCLPLTISNNDQKAYKELNGGCSGRRGVEVFYDAIKSRKKSRMRVLIQ